MRPKTASYLLALAFSGACAGTGEAPHPAVEPVVEEVAPETASEPVATADERRDKEADYEANHRRAAPRDAFPVLDEPEMTPAAESTLEDHEPVIGVVCDGEARAYPVAVMGRHELVNDVCGKTPIAASW